jgi:hypothetical protein
MRSDAHVIIAGLEEVQCPSKSTHRQKLRVRLGRWSLTLVAARRNRRIRSPMRVYGTVEYEKEFKFCQGVT